jgi:hypothetical protein
MQSQYCNATSRARFVLSRDWRPLLRGLALTLAGLALVSADAWATCTVPNTLTNGQPTDATQVMGNFNALAACLDSNGSVSTGSAGQVGVYNSAGSQISGQSLSNILDSNIGSTQGTLIYRGSSGWQALAPGATHYVLGTNGPGADPGWVPQSGGSGGNKFAVFPGGTSGYSVSASAIANVIHVVNTITVSDLAALFSPVNGATYKMGLAGWNSATSKITGSPTYTASQTVAGTSGAPLYFSFSAPVVLTAGNYVVMLIRTDGTPTTSVGLYYGGGTVWAPQLYMTGSSTVYSLASQAPTTSDVWSYQGGGWWDFALMYSY